MSPDQLAADFARMGDALADLTATNATAGALVLGHADPPVLTGFLASTGAVETTPNGFAVIYTAPYAPAVHARNPFLTRALADSEDAVIDIYADAVSAVIK